MGTAPVGAIPFANLNPVGDDVAGSAPQKEVTVSSRSRRPEQVDHSHGFRARADHHQLTPSALAVRRLRSVCPDVLAGLSPIATMASACSRTGSGKIGPSIDRVTPSRPPVQR